MIRSCKNCRHLYKGYDYEPCCHCDVNDITVSTAELTHSRFEPKKPAEKYVPDSCLGCKHDNKRANEEPCQECGIDGQNYYEPKEEKKLDNRKTKAQLMEEIEQKNAEIAELKKELERSENYEQYVNCGKQVREMIDGLVEGGLTEDQAFALFTSVAGPFVAAYAKNPFKL